MFVSGLSHPSFLRAFGGSINEPSEVDGQFVIWFRANPLHVYCGLKLALSLHISAMKLWDASCASPPADDA